jgi:hypothetical protein
LHFRYFAVYLGVDPSSFPIEYLFRKEVYHVHV